MPPGTGWSLPVVGETFDGFLNDINGFHVRPSTSWPRSTRRATAAVEEGAVGGGTGMICHGFKGGIGTSSRLLEDGATVGVLVQANHGQRQRLRVNGVPVGERITAERVPVPQPGSEGAGSIIVLVATDAPLVARPVRAPGSAHRLRHRAAPAGWARSRAATSRSASRPATGISRPTCSSVELRMRSDRHANDLYEAVIDAVEESIVNALLAAETMTGRGGNTAYALEPDLLVEALKT